MFIIHEKMMLKDILFNSSYLLHLRFFHVQNKNARTYLYFE